jgi:hypothetical protein
MFSSDGDALIPGAGKTTDGLQYFSSVLSKELPKVKLHAALYEKLTHFL